MIRYIMLGLLVLTNTAFAHSLFSEHTEDAVAAASVTLAVCVVWLLYFRGARLARPNTYRQLLFHISMILTLLTTLGPLDEWAESSSADHMVQHMLMIVVIGPLVALARPFPQFYVMCGHLMKSLLKIWLSGVQYPMLIAFLHGAMIWVWHIPSFYNLALQNAWVHVFEHACFIVSAVWFWWACLYANLRNVPYALLALLLTLMHTGMLGALLTFSHVPLYGAERQLSDQQLAGLIMWVCGGVPYVAAAIWVANRWFRKLEVSLT